MLHAEIETSGTFSLHSLVYISIPVSQLALKMFMLKDLTLTVFTLKKLTSKVFTLKMFTFSGNLTEIIHILELITLAWQRNQWAYIAQIE